MVPVRSPLQKATAALAMLRLHPGAPGFQACAWHVFFPFPRTSPAQTECLGSFSPRGLAVWRRPEVKKNAAAMGRRASGLSTFWLLFYGGVVWVPSAKWFSWAI